MDKNEKMKSVSLVFQVPERVPEEGLKVIQEGLRGGDFVLMVNKEAMFAVISNVDEGDKARMLLEFLASDTSCRTAKVFFGELFHLMLHSSHEFVTMINDTRDMVKSLGNPEKILDIRDKGTNHR